MSTSWSESASLAPSCGSLQVAPGSVNGSASGTMTGPGALCVMAGRCPDGTISTCRDDSAESLPAASRQTYVME